MKNNIFERADFSGDSLAKEKIFHKMKQAEDTGRVIQMGQAVSDDDLTYVAAAGCPNMNLDIREERKEQK